MQNPIVKCLVLVAVVAGCGAVFWQAQKSLQNAPERSDPDAFVAHSPANTPPAGPPAQPHPPVPDVTPQPEPPQLGSLADFQFPPVEPTPAAPLEPAGEDVAEVEDSLLIARPDPLSLANAEARLPKNGGGVYRFLSASGAEDDPQVAQVQDPPVQPTLARDPAPAGEGVNSLDAFNLAASPSANPPAEQPTTSPLDGWPVANAPEQPSSPPAGEAPRPAAGSPFDEPFLARPDSPPGAAALPDREPSPVPQPEPDSRLAEVLPVLPQSNPAPAGEPSLDWANSPLTNARAEPRQEPAAFPGGDSLPLPVIRPAAGPMESPGIVRSAHAEPAPVPQSQPDLDLLMNPPGLSPEAPRVAPAEMPEPLNARPLTPVQDSSNDVIPLNAFGGPEPAPARSPEPAPLPDVNPLDMPPLPPVNNLPPREQSGDPLTVLPTPLPDSQVLPIENRVPVPAPGPAGANDLTTIPQFDGLPSRDPEPANPPSINPQPNAPTINPLGPGRVATPDPVPPLNPVEEIDLEIPTGPQTPELKIEKIAPAQAVVGEGVVYSILVRNVGGSTARDVVVEDRVPRGAELAGTIPQAYMAEPGRLHWKLGALSPGEQREIKLKVIPLQAGQIGSVATVSFAAAVTASIMVTAPDLKVTIDGPAESVVNEKVTYQLRIRNAGEGIARDVWLRAKLPEGLRHPEGSDLELQIGSLAPGAEHTVQLVAVGEKTGVITAMASVSNDGKVCDQAIADLKVIRARLEISRKGPEGSFVGRPAQFVTTVRNESIAELRNVTLTEQVPPQVEVREVAAGGQWNPNSRVITWTIPVLAPGESRDFASVLASQVDGSYDGLLVAGDAGGNRTELKTNLNVLGFAALTVDVNTPQKIVSIGDQVSLRLTLKNDGTAAARDVTTSFEIPQGLSFTQARGPVRYRHEGQRVVFEPLSEVPVQGTQSFDIVLTAAEEGPAKVKVELQTAGDPEPLRRDHQVRVLSP